MKFVDSRQKRKRHRIKINSHFLATLHEDICGDFDFEELEIIEEFDEPLDSPLQVESPTTTSGSDGLLCADSLEPPIFPKTRISLKQSEPQSGKLQQVLADLKISSLPISESLRRRFICVVRSNLDAFAASPTDLGRTSVVVHTIKPGDAKPFRHKLNAVPFA